MHIFYAARIIPCTHVRPLNARRYAYIDVSQYYTKLAPLLEKNTATYVGDPAIANKNV